jgi:hypothetical protein
MLSPGTALRSFSACIYTMRLVPGACSGARARGSVRASSSGGAATPAPPNIRELAKMAQLAVQDAEVWRMRKGGRAAAASWVDGMEGSVLWPPLRHAPPRAHGDSQPTPPPPTGRWRTGSQRLTASWTGVLWGGEGVARLAQRLAFAAYTRSCASSSPAGPPSTHAHLFPPHAHTYTHAPPPRFGQLQAIDVEGVKPAVHAREEGSVLRPDMPVEYRDRWQWEVGQWGADRGLGLGSGILRIRLA